MTTLATETEATAEREFIPPAPPTAEQCRVIRVRLHAIRDEVLAMSLVVRGAHYVLPCGTSFAMSGGMSAVERTCDAAGWAAQAAADYLDSRKEV